MFCYTKNMSWAGRRRILIITAIAVFLGAFISVAFVSVLYQSPSCNDSKQNQGESGVDCGGPCKRVCTFQVQEPTVQFVSVLKNIGDRKDVVAYIDNANAHASVIDAPYTIELYGSNAATVAKYSGTVSLPPHSTVPIFIPNIYSGTKKIVNAFITFDTASMQWFKSDKTPTVLPVSNIQVVGTTSPRVTATVTNPKGTALINVKIIIAVFDATNNVVTASQTIAPNIPAEGSSQIGFMWNLPFKNPPAKEEVWPILPVKIP